jgi:hypothetical protein
MSLLVARLLHSSDFGACCLPKRLGRETPAQTLSHAHGVARR